MKFLARSLLMWIILMARISFAADAVTPSPAVAQAMQNGAHPTLGSVSQDGLAVSPQTPLLLGQELVPALRPSGSFTGGQNTIDRFVIGIQSMSDGTRVADIFDGGYAPRVRVGDTLPSGLRIVAITANRVDVKTKNKTLSIYRKAEAQPTGR